LRIIKSIRKLALPQVFRYRDAMSLELVSIPEIAKMLGVSRQRVHQLIQQYDDFPNPVAELAIGRVWDRATVTDWNKTHPRVTGRPRKHSA
jgi:predicted DNA-binding transcriptional regulator AlpA